MYRMRLIMVVSVETLSLSLCMALLLFKIELVPIVPYEIPADKAR